MALPGRGWHWIPGVRVSRKRWAGQICLSPSVAVRPSVLLPQGAVAIAFPCSWTQSYCSLESWQLPEKAEQALWPLNAGLRYFTSRSVVDSPREVIIFFNGCVPLSTACGEATNSTLSFGAGKAHMGKAESLDFADY